jgi:HEAT repeat protein
MTEENSVIFDEYEMRKLPPQQRLDAIKQLLKDKQDDESTRWDCVWLAGEIADEVPDNESIQKQIADLMAWVLQNDDNGIVKHEAAFQIGLRNFRERIPELVRVAIFDESGIAKHEAIEALGLMRAHECTEVIKKIAMNDPNPDAKETARFVLKRLDRLKNSGEYKGGPM